MPVRHGAFRVAALMPLMFVPVASCQTFQPSVPGITDPAWTGPAVANVYKDEPEMRVRIHKSMSATTIGGPAQVVVRQAGAGTLSADLMKTPVKVTCSAKGFLVVDNAGARREWGKGNDIEVMANGADAGQSLTIDGTPYPGFATMRGGWTTGSTTFDLAVTMGIESYLPGVLTHELFKDWPSQTYEVGAVAARTYALHERYRARGEGREFDVEDTDADQVFGGATKSVVANDAVKATRGQILTQDGRLIRAYYSSTCGGRPASAKVTWPRKPGTEFNFAPCIQGKPRQHACQGATFYRWSVTRDDNELTKRVKAWGAQYKPELDGMTRIRQIKVDDTNDAGRPNSYKVTDDGGRTFTMSAEELRTASNWNADGLTTVTRETRISSGDFEVTTYANQLTFTGRGWGHGVGMCQWCAKGFAEQGWDRDRMLKEFYPGAVVVKAY